MNHYKRGITIIEILVVIAVLAVIFSIVLPQFSKIRESQVLKSAITDVLSSLNKAQSQTLASVNSSSYGVHFQSDKVIIFRGTSFSSSATDNETVNITLPAIISNITIAGGGADIYFNRLSGTPNAVGSIVISSPNFTKTITISATGTSSVN